jgi:hypothetical protein
MGAYMGTEDESYLLRRLFDMVDSIDKKLDVQVERLADHGARLSAVERDLRDHKAAAADAKRTAGSARQAFLVAITAAILSGGFSILQLFAK